MLKRLRGKVSFPMMVGFVVWLLPGVLRALDGKISGEVVAEHKYLADTLWTIITAVLVFFMQAGFAMVETGFTRAKNAVNIMMKNLMDFCMGSVAYWIVGFGIMFGNGTGFMGQTGFFVTPGTGDLYEALAWTSVPTLTAWFFQLVFAATAATIVSGAMAERTKFVSYFVYSFVVSALIYPIVGHWIWGGGWLAGKGMLDFAGSTVVHSTGGWIALTGAIMLGARKGKYGADGKPRAIPGHSMPLATLGVFILWLGWFGFNPGSTMGADVEGISNTAVTTNLAAAAAAIAAMLTAWLKFGKPDAAMTLNGALAGLVAITAPCYFVTPLSSVIIGAGAGILVVLSVLFFDRIRVDDPVGAVSVHGVCGAFGTIMLGLFHSSQGVLFSADSAAAWNFFWAQVLGVGAVFAFCMVTGFILFALLKFTVGLRVSEEEEVEGLDIHEHGNEAYPDFEVAPGR